LSNAKAHSNSGLGLDALGSTMRRLIRFGAFDPFLTSARFAGVARWGPGIGSMVHASALRWPDRIAIIDDDRQLTWRQLDQRAEALAARLRSEGTGPVGILSRNHAGFILAQLGVERSGRDLALLNTALPARRLADVAEREQLATVIADGEFADLVEAAGLQDSMLEADGLAAVDVDNRWALRSRVDRCRAPRRRSELIMLTSGTTGPPKGARRINRAPAARDLGLIDVVPYRLNDVTHVASPLYHAWGLTQATIALSSGSTVVLRRKFTPRSCLDAVVAHEVTVLAVVPVMLKRLLVEAADDLQLPSLRLTLSSGNVLSASLAERWIDRFGLNLYNIYGSTETAIASVATPDDLIEAPGTVGRPPKGVTVAILDDNDLPSPPHHMGRVFTANNMQFDGYTDGTDRVRHGDLMATGDLGFTDDAGRLFVDGRENDLIVTGGENVFPSEVEDVLEQHPSVGQAAVVGLPDDEYGQRIVAFVVASGAFDTEILQEWVKGELAAFKRPREIRVVDALPMTTTGKVIRHSLATLGLAEHL